MPSPGRPPAPPAPRSFPPRSASPARSGSPRIRWRAGTPAFRRVLSRSAPRTASTPRRPAQGSRRGASWEPHEYHPRRHAGDGPDAGEELAQRLSLAAGGERAAPVDEDEVSGDEEGDERGPA